jgi:uncharacterized protein
MEIGILSDTHGYFHPELPTYLSGLDHILHAGDIGTADVLDRLEAIAPTTAVFGNVDGQDIRLRTAEHARIELGGIRFWMTHIGGHPARWGRGIGPLLKAAPPDVFVCGHSHILRIERVESLRRMLFINPGAAGRQGFHQVKTCVRLTIRDGVLSKADVIHLDPEG